MRTLKILAFLLAAVSLSVLDEEQSYILRVEELVSRSPSTVSYMYLGDGWFEFTDVDGLTWQRMFGETQSAGGLKPKKIISIDLRQIDTTGYAKLFSEIAVVPLGLEFKPPVGSFIAADNLCELTAQSYQIAEGFTDVRMFKLDSISSMFKPAMIFLNKFSANGSADIDQNGIPEIVGDSLGCILTFEGSAPSRLDLKLKHFWYGKTGSAQVPRVFDLDEDGFPEIVISQFGDGFDGTRIVKFDQPSQKLKRVFQIRYPNNPGHRGYWAVGDFDLDGKMEFVNANYAGEVYFVEHVQGDTSYAISFSDTTRYINAFFHTEGNDLDGDGRPECFIGSDNTAGLNNIAVYETTGDNKFEVSLWIEIYPLGSFIWPWIWTGDVTGDGKDEIVLTSGNAVVIIKAFGDDDYRVIWFKRYNSELSHRLFDTDRDGVKEILVSMTDGGSGFEAKRFTRILQYRKLTSTSTLSQKTLSISVKIYPNPASAQVVISLLSPVNQTYDLSILTITGSSVYQVSGYLEQGRTRNVTVSNFELQNGLYFLHLKTRESSSIKKIMIIK